MDHRKSLLLGAILSLSTAAKGQSLEQIVDRLNRLEQENNNLRREIQVLRGEIETLRGGPAPPGPTIAERTEITERRIDEQAQTKVESSQKFPIKLTGMALANIFRNGRQANNQDHSTTAARIPGRSSGALTFRQSIIGLEYAGPATFAGGKVGGAMSMDFYEGNTETTNFAPFRLRTATIHIDWNTRSLTFGQEKPLISQRDPSSFSFVGVSPLTAAGNLWRWQPQVRFEQRVNAAPKTQVKGQIALYQTSEESTTSAAVSLERRRPGLEGRLEVGHDFDEQRRIAIAPGFHVSESHINGINIPSRLASIDWFANPWSRVEFSGLAWTGKNIHHFGSMRQGITLLPSGRIIPVESKGGWAQVAFPFTPRVTLNLFGGIHDDRNRDLAVNNIGVNRTSALNVMYRIAPNVILTLEGMQIRTTYVGSGNRKNNRYDLSVAYLF
jgi:cell division protein FtsB